MTALVNALRAARLFRPTLRPLVRIPALTFTGLTLRTAATATGTVLGLSLVAGSLFGVVPGSLHPAGPAPAGGGRRTGAVGHDPHRDWDSRRW